MGICLFGDRLTVFRVGIFVQIHRIFGDLCEIFCESNGMCPFFVCKNKYPFNTLVPWPLEFGWESIWRGKNRGLDSI